MPVHVSPKFFEVSKLGECQIKSPLSDSPVHFHTDNEAILLDRDYTALLEHTKAMNGCVPVFERAGIRKMIFHDPRWSKAAILTAGGLCPGLNDVIKGLTLTLRQTYGVPLVYGIPYGYAGLNSDLGYQPVILNEDTVDNIHETGGTILGSSRGAQDPEKMLETLVRMDINMLFCIGGDGTLRSAHAIAEAAKKRNLKISVVGIPKTIDNDICFMDRTFGFETAVYATNPISGFIAAYATLANTHINFCLVPEVKFSLNDGENAFMPTLFERIRRRHHAVIIVAEGAGQELIPGEREYDKSGNLLNKNIGTFLKDEIKRQAKEAGLEVNVKYFDPTYQIRAGAANGTDAVFCLMLAQNAVHAAMAGRTDVVIGHWSESFTHVPIPMAVKERKKIDPVGSLWQAVRLNTWHM